MNVVAVVVESVAGVCEGGGGGDHSTGGCGRMGNVGDTGVPVLSGGVGDRVRGCMGSHGNVKCGSNGV